MFSDNTFALHGGSSSSLRLYDMGLATIVGKFNQDSTGNQIDYKMKQTMKRMIFWDARSKAKNTEHYIGTQVKH